MSRVGLTDVSIGVFAGSAVAFGLAAVAVGFDVQDTVRARLGELANTSVLMTWQGWAVLFGWGLFDALLYFYIINNPQWATNTFNFDVAGNKVWAGAVVGVSAVLIIRSKLAKIGSVELGGEFAYLWSRAYVLDAVNGVRVQKRIENEKQYASAARDISKYPSLYTELAAWIDDRSKGKSEAARALIMAQMSEIKRQAKPSPADADQDPNARKYLFGLAIDYFKPAEIEAWDATVLNPQTRRRSS